MGSLDRHAAAFGAVRTLLAAHGLPGDRLETWKDGSNLLVRPVPAPVILRVATFTGRIRRDPMPYLEREVALVTWLASRGAPVMAPADVMPPGPFLVDGWGIAAWRFVDHRPGVVPGRGRDPRRARRAAARSSAPTRASCPRTGPPRPTSTSRSASRWRRHPRPAAVDALRRRRDMLLARLRALDPSLEPQHGDAFPRNTVVDRAGRVTWIDLEDACLASPAWDLAVLARHTGDAAVRAAAEARVGREVLDTAIALRGVQGEVWNALHDARVARGW